MSEDWILGPYWARIIGMSALKVSGPFLAGVAVSRLMNWLDTDSPPAVEPEPTVQVENIDCRFVEDYCSWYRCDQLPTRQEKQDCLRRCEEYQRLRAEGHCLPGTDLPAAD